MYGSTLPTWGVATWISHHGTVSEATLPQLTTTVLAWQGRWQKILQLLGSIEPDVVLLGAAIGSLDRWEVSFLLLRRLPVLRLRRTLRAYGSLLRACERAAVWRRAALCLPKTSSSKGLILYNSQISACGKNQVWKDDYSKEALDQQQRSEELGFSRELVSSTCSISACEKSSNWQIAIGLLAQMRRKRIQKNLITFDSAISSEKGWKRALLLFSEIKFTGVWAFDLDSQVAQLGGCDHLLMSLRSHWGWTQHLLVEMQAMAVKQDILSYNLASSSYGRKSEWQRAGDVLSQLQHRGLKVQMVTVGSLLSAYEVVDLWKSALQLLATSKLSDLVDVVAVNAVTSSMLHWPKAMHLQRWLGNPSRVGQNALLAKVGRWQITLQLLKDMQRQSGVDQVAFNTSLDVLKVSWMHALSLLWKMSQVLLQMDVLSVNAVS